MNKINNHDHGLPGCGDAKAKGESRNKRKLLEDERLNGNEPRRPALRELEEQQKGWSIHV